MFDKLQYKKKYEYTLLEKICCRQLYDKQMIPCEANRGSDGIKGPEVTKGDEFIK